MKKNTENLSNYSNTISTHPGLIIIKECLPDSLDTIGEYCDCDLNVCSIL